MLCHAVNGRCKLLAIFFCIYVACGGVGRFGVGVMASTWSAILLWVWGQIPQWVPGAMLLVRGIKGKAP